MGRYAKNIQGYNTTPVYQPIPIDYYMKELKDEAEGYEKNVNFSNQALANIVDTPMYDQQAKQYLTEKYKKDINNLADNSGGFYHGAGNIVNRIAQERLNPIYATDKMMSEKAKEYNKLKLDADSKGQTLLNFKTLPSTIRKNDKEGYTPDNIVDANSINYDAVVRPDYVDAMHKSVWDSVKASGNMGDVEDIVTILRNDKSGLSDTFLRKKGSSQYINANQYMNAAVEAYKLTPEYKIHKREYTELDPRNTKHDPKIADDLIRDDVKNVGKLHEMNVSNISMQRLGNSGSNENNNSSGFFGNKTELLPGSSPEFISSDIKFGSKGKGDNLLNGVFDQPYVGLGLYKLVNNIFNGGVPDTPGGNINKLLTTDYENLSHAAKIMGGQYINEGRTSPITKQEWNNLQNEGKKIYNDYRKEYPLDLNENQDKLFNNIKKGIGLNTDAFTTEKEIKNYLQKNVDNKNAKSNIPYTIPTPEDINREKNDLMGNLNGVTVFNFEEGKILDPKEKASIFQKRDEIGFTGYGTSGGPLVELTGNSRMAKPRIFTYGNKQYYVSPIATSNIQNAYWETLTQQQNRTGLPYTYIPSGHTNDGQDIKIYPKSNGSYEVIKNDKYKKVFNNEEELKSVILLNIKN